VIIEANHEGGNNIELLSQVRERTKRLNSLNNTADAEQACYFSKHRQAIYIKTHPGMTEQFCNVKKVSCAAAEIQYPLWPRQIEFKLTDPANVDSDPALEIKILWPICSGICYGIPSANLFKLDRINRIDDALCPKHKPVGVQHPERVLSRTSQASAIDQLSYFMPKSHSPHLVAKRHNFN
jgi:hypothetical protein